ncbi:eukaryotic translation initiation factor 3 subunit J-like isoform X1 [Asparagus officinalis]|uniref:eukaryotic translation initiation factor 3 subunit J-like isoform X1 n=1 Tax=Asparagus officinalis TaxID=4686 RepID=UPI00098E3417|nr:eukaryotic translation initiation factor 3 subunit J-like isoform X1 [Asparagus officinalis]
MADWEDEEFEPSLPSLKKEQPKGVWDDEDADDEDVKESWEDEEEPKQAPKQEPKEEKTAKPANKSAGKKTKQPEAKATEVADQVLADPVAEKLRQQRLVEEADYKATAELFAKKGDEKSLDNFIPKSESDFLEYAELLSHKIRPYEKSFHYIGLVKAVIKLSLTSVKAADAKDVASSITAIANEKLKAEKEANAGKKKQGGKKKQLHVDKPDDDVAAGHYDDVDDYDFM